MSDSDAKQRLARRAQIHETHQWGSARSQETSNMRCSPWLRRRPERRRRRFRRSASEKNVRSGLEGAHCEVCVGVGPGVYRNDVGFHPRERLAIVGEARYVGPSLDDVIALGDGTAAQTGELVAVETVICLGVRYAHVAEADDEDAEFRGYGSFHGVVD